MAKLNPKGIDGRLDRSGVRVAGGFGAIAAHQDAESLLRRSVMSCLLWEDLAYETGAANAKNMADLIPQVAPERVASIAIEAREKQKLRHAPLWIARHMLKYPEHKKFARNVIERIITRADQLTDFVALYKNDGSRSIPRQMKRGLADAFAKFDAYQFAKYDRNDSIKLRDVMRLCHPKPENGHAELYKQVLDRTLPTPDTWESALVSGADKKETFERLIKARKLGNLALLRNLRNMIEAGVSGAIIREGLSRISDRGLLPLNFFSALQYAPGYADEIEQAMFRAYASIEKLPGFTVFVVDVSGSMQASISSKSQFNRIDCGAAMAVLARESCERAAIYATAGSDDCGRHDTKQIPNIRGFGLVNAVREAKDSLGGGGIFTRQCLEYIKQDLKGERPDRIIVFSDSQDMDRANPIPAPFGIRNYIIDVSSHARGINYKGVWTAEISGWSENFLSFIAAYEGLNVGEQSEQ